MHHRPLSLRRAIVVVVATLALAAVSAVPVAADQGYHTDRLPVWVTADGVSAGYPSLRAGQVVNIHASGPTVFAHERYMLNGAAPDTSWGIVWTFVDDAGVAAYSTACADVHID